MKELEIKELKEVMLRVKTVDKTKIVNNNLFKL